MALQARHVAAINPWDVALDVLRPNARQIIVNCSHRDPAVAAARSSGELAFDAIESLKMGFGSMLSAPASTAGSRPTILASALWLSSVAKSLSPKPTEVDIVEFLVNPFKCNICALTPLVSATEITEALAMAAQAKITDSNSSATVQGYVYAIKQLVKSSNNIDDMPSTTNIWFWISGLGCLNLELAQLLARCLQPLRGGWGAQIGRPADVVKPVRKFPGRIFFYGNRKKILLGKTVTLTKESNGSLS